MSDQDVEWAYIYCPENILHAHAGFSYLCEGGAVIYVFDVLDTPEVVLVRWWDDLRWGHSYVVPGWAFAAYAMHHNLKLVPSTVVYGPGGL